MKDFLNLILNFINNFNITYNNFIEIFNNENPDFDIYFYSHYYEDLLLFKNKLKLMHHYYFIGKNENRYISENDFNNRNLDFIDNFKIDDESNFCKKSNFFDIFTILVFSSCSVLSS